MNILKIVLVIIVVYALLSILWPVLLFLLIIGIIYIIFKKNNVVNINITKNEKTKNKKDDVMEASFTEKEN